jgi:curli biogenesis system outer membrane secretion channel CsgG
MTKREAGRNEFVKVVLAAVLALAVFAGASSMAADKVRIAVVDFDTSAVHSSWRYGWSYNKLARAAADNLTNKLVQAGAFSVIERQQLDKVLAEQNLGTSGRLDPSTAADLGKVLGVQLIVIGSVNEFGIEEKGGSLRSIGKRLFGGGGASAKLVTGEVGLGARLIDTTTAEILGAWDAEGKHTFGKGSVGGASLGKSWDSGLASEVLAEAVEKLAGNISSAAAGVEPSDMRGDVEGLIAKVGGSQVYINVGSGDGIRVGDRLEVRSQGEEIIDPSTGESLGAMEETIGTIEVVKIVNDRLSVAKPVEGSGFAQGDRVLLK